MRIVVAGATGYLGGFVARTIKAEGHWVRVLARDAGQVTRSETLTGLCDGVEVFSSVGITRQKDGLSYEDVDCHGNLNLLREAPAHSVGKLLYVSVLAARDMAGAKIVDAKERFAAALMQSGIDYVVVHPSGFFSEIEDFLAMARWGRVFLLGDGRRRVNPIHGSDLARFCAEALNLSHAERDVGGPVVYTHEQIAQRAFDALGKPAKITHVPEAFGRTALGLLRAFTSAKTCGPIEFDMAVLTRDMVGPTFGEHRLEAFFAELAVGAGGRDGAAGG